MNDPSKAIDVNLSSLLSLKAELLRKQAEVNKVKMTRPQADEYIANRCNSNSSETLDKKNKKQRAKKLSNEGDAIIYEHEDSALLEKSQRVLQAKSKFYERMSRTGGKLNSDDNCLVMFNRKRQDENDDEKSEEKHQSSASDLSASSSDDEAEPDPEDEWVEFTDCLGRTRKCLRRDLESAKQRDQQLAASMPERLDQSKANWMLDTKGTHSNEASDDEPIGPMPPESIISEGCSFVSKHEEQRSNWERKEVENLDKTDVHYQDVFFDEARQHGVGYYAFSTDEEERKRQQQELEKTRQRTIAEQVQRDALRKQREKIVAERVLAAKNRQRARLGLPPLDEKELAEKSTDAEKPKETKEERKERKRTEKLKRKQEKEEKKRELERKQHLRPWDAQKDGVAKSSTNGFEAAKEAEWTYKPERLPMSQEEWNEHKRAERNAEFAPVPEMTTFKPQRVNFSSMPPPPTPNTVSIMPEAPTAFKADNFAPFQSTKREKHFQRRNYQVESNEDERITSKGATIPPPANLDIDAALPPFAKKPKTNNQLESSIEAGLRFLRNNCDKGTMSTKSSWTAKADY